jgi:hypothetical protein
MNAHDDDEIRARLSSLFDDEPPMESIAVDDLGRGRQLLRRRRRSAVVATATALPAVLVGGWALSTAVLGSSGSVSTLQPADETEPTDTGDPATAAPTPNAAEDCQTVPYVGDDCSTSSLRFLPPGEPGTAGSGSQRFREIAPSGAGRRAAPTRHLRAKATPAARQNPATTTPSRSTPLAP